MSRRHHIEMIPEQYHAWEFAEQRAETIRSMADEEGGPRLSRSASRLRVRSLPFAHALYSAQQLAVGRLSALRL